MGSSDWHEINKYKTIFVKPDNDLIFYFLIVVEEYEIFGSLGKFYVCHFDLMFSELCE